MLSRCYLAFNRKYDRVFFFNAMSRPRLAIGIDFSANLARILSEFPRGWEIAAFDGGLPPARSSPDRSSRGKETGAGP